MRRLNNQDSHLVMIAPDEATWRDRGHLLLVADGMGAHAAGELASKLAAEGVGHHYHKQRQLSPPEAILKAVRDTNSEIHRRGQMNVEFHNMGTTCSALLLLPQGALAAHVGDSRIYRLRNDKLQQITFDHSLVWEMQAAGQLGSGDLGISIPRNVITRSLGPQPNVQVDLEGPFELQSGDVFLLCSDGLTTRVTDQEMGGVLVGLPPDEAAQMLIDLANIRGGPDNITVIIARSSAATPAADRRSEPLYVGGDSQLQRVVHPATWITMAVCGLFAAGLAISGQHLAAIVATCLGLLMIPLAAWQRYAAGSDGVSLTGGRRLGRGPYVSIDCPLTHDFVLRLCESVRESLLFYGDSQLGEETKIVQLLDDVTAKTKSAAGSPQENLGQLAAAVRVFSNALGRLS